MKFKIKEAVVFSNNEYDIEINPDATVGELAKKIYETIPKSFDAYSLGFGKK